MRDHGSHPYRRLLAMVGLHFVAMYVLMYAMTSALQDVYHNVNQVYMAGLMTASMVAIEVPVMRAMYASRPLNAAFVGGSLLALVACYLFIRQQTAVGDRQFLRSMIPHHSSAILMCEEASLRDQEISALCGSIVRGQQAEIDQMRAILRRLED